MGPCIIMLQHEVMVVDEWHNNGPQDLVTVSHSKCNQENVRCPWHTPAHTITPPPPWATQSTTLTSANRSPSQCHTQSLPSALYSENQDSSVKKTPLQSARRHWMWAFTHSSWLRWRTAVRWRPRWGRRACRWASLRRFLTVCAEILWLYKPIIAAVVRVTDLRWFWRWRCWTWRTWAGVVTHGLRLWGWLAVLPNSLKCLWKQLMVDKWTFNSQATALVDIPSLSMPIARSLKTCDVCVCAVCIVMMAPVSMACRLSPCCLLFAIVLFICICCRDVSASLVYDRQTFYNIRASVDTLSGRYGLGNHQTTGLPPYLADIPAFLRRPPCVIPRKKRWRRRGKRGGVLVRFKAYLASVSRDGCYIPAACRGWCQSPWRWWVAAPLPVASSDATAAVRVHLAAAQRSLEMRGRWLHPVFPSSTMISETDLSTVSSPLRVRVRLRRGGVDSSNLRQLNRAALPLSEDHTLRLALINARSLANKTFLLNDFFTSRELDFMFLTETWLQTGELIPLSELLPPSCDFLSSPRTTGRGGGLASVFKSVFHCQKIAVDVYSSFELQLFEINFPATVLCAVVYRPPKYNKNFIQDFADFVAGITLIYDRFLIMGDFNIHVCCESKPLVKEFLSLVDSFNLTQSVTGPTHEKGHTLDLVLSCGLCITINEICDTGISDHLPVLFTVVVPNSEISTCASSRSFRAINPLTASQFSSVFKDSLLYNLDDCDLSVEEFTVLFDCICTEILDSVAPLRKKHPKVVSEPWLNDTTRSLRRACRVAERKWKKDKLKISFIMMQDALYKYQRAVKSAKTIFFQTL